MIEEAVKGVLNALISQGGAWLIVVLLIAVVMYLARKLEKAQESCDDSHAASEQEVRAQYDKRLEEMGKLLDALNRSTAALSAMQISVDARAEAMNNLVAGFAMLVRDLEQAQQRWKERGEAVSTRLGAIEGRLEDLQRRVP